MKEVHANYYDYDTDHCRMCGREFDSYASWEEKSLKDRYGFEYKETSEYKDLLARKERFCSTHCQKAWYSANHGLQEESVWEKILGFGIILGILLGFLYFMYAIIFFADMGHWLNPVEVYKEIFW